MDIQDNLDSASRNEVKEKKLVREFFNHCTDGLFVDVGSNDPKSILSQTWHLEQIGWSGILIEPLLSFRGKTERERPNSVLFSVACSSPEKVGRGSLKIPMSDDREQHTLASLDDANYFSELKNFHSQETDVVSLDSILEKEDVNTVDFVSIDVEGAEIDVLRGFNINKYRPQLILIEDNLVFLDKHLYLRRNGYKLVKRTGVNNWYIPKKTHFKLAGYAERVKLFNKFFLRLFFRKVKEAVKNWTLKPFRKL